jgi:hypothetical protein
MELMLDAQIAEKGWVAPMSRRRPTAWMADPPARGRRTLALAVMVALLAVVILLIIVSVAPSVSAAGGCGGG